MTSEAASRGEERPLVLAQYLPQFHPIPENDVFWGSGFTEWRSVSRGKPRFEGHDQPFLPGELGFYDLRLAETRAAQAALAAQHGIDGFVYYHYWLNGRRLLEGPFEEVLASGSPSLPFCLCWANESWDGTWNGRSDQVFVAQDYSAEDDELHGRYLANAFADPRYLRINGRPLLLIYRIQHLPDPAATLARWANICAEQSIPAPYVVRFETYGSTDDPANYGADAAAEFFPHVPETVLHEARQQGFGGPDDLFLDYGQIARALQDRPSPPWRRFPAVVPGWDNTARRPDRPCLGLLGRSPAVYQAWLEASLRRQIAEEPPGQRVVFINAWNEWAESACLEPTLNDGRAYLEATAAAVSAVSGPRQPAAPAGDHAKHADQADRLASAEARLAALDSKYRVLVAEHTAFLNALPRRVEGEVAKLRAELEQARAEARRLAEVVLALRSASPG